MLRSKYITWSKYLWKHIEEICVSEATLSVGGYQASAYFLCRRLVWLRPQRNIFCGWLPDKPMILPVQTPFCVIEAVEDHFMWVGTRQAYTSCVDSFLCDWSHGGTLSVGGYQASPYFLCRLFFVWLKSWRYTFCGWVPGKPILSVQTLFCVIEAMEEHFMWVGTRHVHTSSVDSFLLFIAAAGDKSHPWYIPSASSDELVVLFRESSPGVKTESSGFQQINIPFWLSYLKKMVIKWDSIMLIITLVKLWQHSLQIPQLYKRYLEELVDLYILQITVTNRAIVILRQSWWLKGPFYISPIISMIRFPLHINHSSW